MFSLRNNFIIIITFLCNIQLFSAQNLTQYVDPRIGTGDHGHVFLGANVPFGIVMAGPTQDSIGWDWCSGYHESGTKIVGFAQTHLSGTGCSDLGDIALMPANEPISLTREGLATPYSHDKECVRPGYYSVMLPERNINVEITATCRTALYRFTYGNADGKRLVVDLDNGIGDHVMYGRMTQIDDTTFVGYRISHGWANEQHLYFAMRLNQPARIVRQAYTPTQLTSSTGQFSPIYEILTDGNSTELMARVAISPVSEMNALLNMTTEAYRCWDFDAETTAATDAWNRELSRIEATFFDERDCKVFYTSLYHFFVAPQIWDDVNGDYRGADNRIYRSVAKPQTHYLTTLSLWDTYRAAAPLSTIILPDMMPSVVETYLRIFREQGKLPVWHLMSQETNCMVGCPAVPILADLLMKGYVQDTLLAWTAIKNSLMMDERGLNDMKLLGYVANDHHSGSLSMSLEYMLADWSAAQVAQTIIAAGVGDDQLHNSADYFQRRASGFTKLYDKRVGFLRSRNSSGDFPAVKDFNPAFQTRDYTEGNPWQYLWLVPHDVDGLSQMLGGRQRTLLRLDSLFTADSGLNSDANPDITGLIGQYAHGNEPSHHIAYLYTMLNQPERTAQLVRRIMRELYTDQPAGLCGNEDVGQMSAWYILSALGFYQVQPCGGKYVIGSPLVKEAKVNVGNGRTLTIRAHNNSSKHFRVHRVKFNGRTIKDFTLNHSEIMQGGTIDFYMK